MNEDEKSGDLMGWEQWEHQHRQLESLGLAEEVGTGMVLQRVQVGTVTVQSRYRHEDLERSAALD